jgi:hypothetical protein
MGRGPARVFSCLLLLAASSCAGNALRVEAAADVHGAADTFVNDAHAALDDARVQRLQANAALVASDVSCEPLRRIVVQRRTGGARRGRVPLCASSAAPRLNYQLDEIDLRPISEDSLKPTILLIGAIGDYGAALGKIAARPDVDISKELGSFAGRASSASALANGLLGTHLPDPEKLLATDQAKSALALLQFFAGLANEQAKVRDINRYVAAHGAKVEAVIPELRAQLRNWIVAISQGDAEIYQNSLVRAYGNERTHWSFDQRLAFATRVNESRAQSAAAPARAAALDQALTDFADAEATLRRMLAGDFTPAERRRMAKIQGQRMLDALDLISKTVIAFGRP